MLTVAAKNSVQFILPLPFRLTSYIIEADSSFVNSSCGFFQIRLSNCSGSIIPVPFSSIASNYFLNLVISSSDDDFIFTSKFTETFFNRDLPSNFLSLPITSSSILLFFARSLPLFQNHGCSRAYWQVRRFLGFLIRSCFMRSLQSLDTFSNSSYEKSSSFFVIF